MQSIEKKARDTLRSRLHAYLKRKDILFPKASSFGIQEPGIFQKPKLSFREKSYQVVSFAQQGEDLILNRIFERRLGENPRKKAGFYMDVGAFHPISHSISYGLYKFGWSGVCVDISKDTCALVKKFRPRDHVFHCAVGEADADRNAVSVERLSLVNQADHDVAGRSADSLINSRSISSILSEVEKAGRVDYLNIDIEGAELAALEGLDFHTYRPRVISIEIHAKDICSALDTDVARKLLGEGYLPVGCAAITYFFVHEDDLS
jgi:FkbM family methyltransferase